jgi:hypothetical protein
MLLMEWLAISHGCLWQMYQLREKKILPIVLPSMVEVENFQATHVIIYHDARSSECQIHFPAFAYYVAQWFFLWLDSPSGPRPPDCRDFETTLRHTKLGRTPMDEWSVHRRDLYLTAHSKHNRLPCPRRETSGRRPTPFRPRCPRYRHTVYVPWVKTSAHRTSDVFESDICRQQCNRNFRTLTDLTVVCLMT